MSVDTVNESLTRVRLSVQKNWTAFSEDSFRRMISIMDVQRDYLMREDARGFMSYTQERLGTDPDCVVFIMESLCQDLLGNERATWQEFEQELLYG